MEYNLHSFPCGMDDVTCGMRLSGLVGKDWCKVCAYNSCEIVSTLLRYARAFAHLYLHFDIAKTWLS